MAPAEARNIQKKLIAVTLAVTFMIKILTSSQLIPFAKDQNQLATTKCSS